MPLNRDTTKYLVVLLAVLFLNRSGHHLAFAHFRVKQAAAAALGAILQSCQV